MRLVLLVVLAVAVALPAAPVPAAQEEDGTRAAFIKSRPPAPTAKKRPPRKPRRKPVPTPTPVNGSATAPVVPVASAGPVGLGFSLFQVFDRTTARRADPSSVFREGDHLRFVLESSIDGYLYIFLITRTKAGEKRPVMIYPDARLDEGDNFVYAHTVVEVPSRRNTKFDIFRITGEPATEQLFFVVSRDPLPGVPIAEELVELCQGSPQSCPWSPAGAVWEPLERQASAEVRVSVRKDAGKAVSQGEDTAIAQRDLALGSSDEQPTVVAVSASSDAALLVRPVSIRHE